MRRECRCAPGAGGARAALALAALGAALGCGAPARVSGVYPPVQRARLGEGRFDAAGCALFVPGDSDAKVRAVAELLRRRLALRLGVELEIRRAGRAPEGRVLLALAHRAPDWEREARAPGLARVPGDVADQGYALRIDGEGAVLAARAARGLAYGATALMQLARSRAEGTRLPRLAVTDWPDLPLRAAHGRHDHGLWESARACERVAAAAADLRFNMLVWENDGGTFRCETHPELNRGRVLEKDEYARLAGLVRSAGIEPVPLFNLSNGHHTKGGHPYPFLGDGETYFWAVTDLFDERLEVFRPRFVHLGMDEEKFIGQLKFPVRSLCQWRDVAARLARHGRRRGVSVMMWTDLLWDRHHAYEWPSGGFGKGYDGFLATFPEDLVLVPWLYYPHLFPELEKQARSGRRTVLASWWGDGAPHARLVRGTRKRHPNVLGVLGTCWGGNSQHRRQLYLNAGPFWNADAPPSREGFRPQEEDLAPMGLECLLEAEPAGIVAEALARLADARPEVWLGAREALVARGPEAAAELLSAMSGAQGEMRERVEGCLSRLARDARAGVRRGGLDAPRAARFLEDADGDVRAIAAELLASCLAPGERAALLAGLGDPAKCAACARALALVKDERAVEGLLAALADAGMPAQARAGAARALGALRAEGAAGALLAALRGDAPPGLRKAALWSLALVRAPGADVEIARLLDAPDADTRWRAAIALVLLESPEAKRLAPWLTGGDAGSVAIACWAMRRMGPGRFEGCVPALAGAVRHERPLVRANAVYSLGLLGAADEGSLAALAGALDDADTDVRLCAIRALGRLGRKAAAACGALASALEDRKVAVRQEAASALGRLREGAGPAVPALVKALGDPDRTVRQNAAWSLGSAGPGARPALEALLEALAGDEDAHVRANSAFALGRIGAGPGRLVPALVRALGDSRAHVRACAAISLGRLGEAAGEAVPALEAARRTGDESVRWQAGQALKKIRGQE